MKTHTAALGALILALLAGCQQATDSDDSDDSASFGTTQSLTVTSTSAVTYWDLDTGTEVTAAAEIASNKWDIALSSGSQGVWTNSGATATAAGSSGLGGVYYSGSTVFTDVTSYTTAGFDADWSTDTSVSVSTAGQSGSTTSVAVLNKITALDYVSGTGTAEDPYVNDSSTAVYDGDAYYNYVSGTGLVVSNEVYIVRSGDGTGFFKFQVAAMSGGASSRVRDIKYAVYQ